MLVSTCGNAECVLDLHLPSSPLLLTHSSLTPLLPYSPPPLTPLLLSPPLLPSSSPLLPSPPLLIPPTSPPGPWYGRYLASRDPLVLNLNPFFAFKNDPRTTDQVHSSVKPSDGLASAILLHSMLQASSSSSPGRQGSQLYSLCCKVSCLATGKQVGARSLPLKPSTL